MGSVSSLEWCLLTEGFVWLFSMSVKEVDDHGGVACDFWKFAQLVILKVIIHTSLQQVATSNVKTRSRVASWFSSYCYTHPVTHTLRYRIHFTTSTLYWTLYWTPHYTASNYVQDVQSTEAHVRIHTIMHLQTHTHTHTHTHAHTHTHTLLPVALPSWGRRAGPTTVGPVSEARSLKMGEGASLTLDWQVTLVPYGWMQGVRGLPVQQPT